MAPTRRLLSVHETKSNSPAFADALTLLRVWANQRGYGCSTRSSMCLAGFESMGAWWAAILELVIRGEDASARVGNTGKVRKPLGQGLSSYQLFKSAINFLGKAYGLWFPFSVTHVVFSNP
jgi:U3 small nucleolar RNA-associated protein 22